MPDNTALAEVVLHPVRLRIIQQLGGRNRTTAQLREALPDIPQATLYRHVAALLDARVVAVVDERRSRGAIERTLALGDRMASIDHAELSAMSSAQLSTAFLTFLGDVTGDFDRFLSADSREARELVGFARTPLYVNTEDLATIQAGLAELLTPYLTERQDGQQRVNLATILLPDP
ncbi:transcriptional regulator [Microbacterium sorbitolivorans]|uniref:ArsR family transcriptional regulator n=1 Tax=Microbacterium sorbitolivorans TaxID=1867410 RepID=A0A367Y5K6_9MICO|nr:helix-turn-helix domain-containing protein [Microbacterium sorbitolivorans]RCK61153.1 ArsR family transcriptional regulator [Microbacterium sorbitolivorans]GGF34631.1 transcriptional regulator [Microbacterium sorbitolivorans]